MAFMMEKILNDARKLANRLKEHDGSTDNLVTQMTALNKKIDSMKTFQENLPDLNELVLRKPRGTIKLGLSQENSQIRELEQENKELKQSLEEHELSLELIMSRYRQQVTKLLVSNQVDESMLYKETVQAQEVQDKAEHIHEMGSVMWKAISGDDQSIYDTQQVLAQLKIENQGMRELLHICCSSGNPLRISDRQTQTDGLPLFSSAIRSESSTVSSAVGGACTESSTVSTAVGGACRGGNVPCASTVVSCATLKALKSLKPSERVSLPDCVAAGASKTNQESDEQAGLKSLGTSAFVLPSDAFASPLMPSVQESNSPEKMPSSEPHTMQGLATASNETQVPLGKGTVESSTSSSPPVTDKNTEVQEQQPMIPCTSETKDTSSQETLSDPTTVRLPELVLENHANENQIPNDIEMLATEDSQLHPSLNSVAVSAMQEPDISLHASSSLSNITTASSLTTTTAAATTTTTAATTTTESASSQSRNLASSTLKNQTTSPKSAALLSSGKNVSIPSGGTPKNPTSSGHVTPQRTTATPSSGSSTSRLKHGATTPSGVPSKTPTRSPTARDSAPGSSGGATAVKLTSGSPSVHSAKTSAAAHSPRATPIRIKATKQPPSVVASVAPPATISSPSTTTTSCVPLDSNGNSHTSTTVLNEISNINNMPKDATVDGQ